MSEAATKDQIEDVVITEITEILGVPAEEIDVNKHVLQLGLDSVQVVKILVAVGEKLGRDPQEFKPWEHDTLGKWIAHVQAADA